MWLDFAVTPHFYNFYCSIVSFKIPLFLRENSEWKGKGVFMTLEVTHGLGSLFRFSSFLKAAWLVLFNILGRAEVVKGLKRMRILIDKT